jgi:hypothetical protein
MQVYFTFLYLKTLHRQDLQKLTIYLNLKICNQVYKHCIILRHFKIDYKVLQNKELILYI